MHFVSLATILDITILKYEDIIKISYSSVSKTHWTLQNQKHVSGISDKGPSEKRTTSQQRTNCLTPFP